MYVIDSNVFSKLFIEEDDSIQAIRFFQHCIEQETPLLAPSLYDSCYHALAIEQGAVFITADKRHKVKAEAFGHIMLLGDWSYPG